MNKELLKISKDDGTEVRIFLEDGKYCIQTWMPYAFLLDDIGQLNALIDVLQGVRLELELKNATDQAGERLSAMTQEERDEAGRNAMLKFTKQVLIG